MARRTKKVASRGSVNNIILESLMTGDKYGYEIIKEIEEKTNGKVKLKQPSLYSSLKRFEAKEYIDSYWEDSDIGGRRHYYRITDAGKEYYKKKTTNSLFDDDDDVESEVATESVTQLNETDAVPFDYDEHDEDETLVNNHLYSFSVEEKMKSLLNEQTEPTVVEQEVEPSTENKEILDELYDAINEEESLNESINNDTIEETPEVVPDHIFYSPAPLADQPTDEVDDIEEIEELDEPILPEPPKKNYEIITDEFGITKLKTDVTPPKPSRVIDNVQGRMEYKDYVIDSKPKQVQQTTPFDELSDEERTRRSQDFVQRFHEISEEKSQTQDVNYKTILGELFVNDDETPVETTAEPVQEEVFSNLSFEPVKETSSTEGNFNGTLTIEKYTQDIQEEGFNVKLYNKPKDTTYKNEYLLINKLKFAFGLILTVLMVVQITAVMIMLKSKDLLFSDQNWVYISGYVLAVLLGLVYCIPVFVSPNAQQTKSIKFNYTMLFGSLAFFVSIILIYAINTFMGLDFTNTNHFLSTLIVPAILATNFIVGPIIYKLLSRNKSFY